VRGWIVNCHVNCVHTRLLDMSQLAAVHLTSLRSGLAQAKHSVSQNIFNGGLWSGPSGLRPICRIYEYFFGNLIKYVYLMHYDYSFTIFCWL